MSIKAPLLLALPPADAEPVRAGMPAIDAAAEAREQQAARSAQLEQLALEHARCEDAAAACYYLCRSLGAARQLEPSEPGLELLFELLGALADLPLPAAEGQQPAETQGEADGLGVFELCQQLQSAREQSQEAWREMTEPDEACGPALFLH
jgi:hypothetical protein